MAVPTFNGQNSTITIIYLADEIYSFNALYYVTVSKAEVTMRVERTARFTKCNQTLKKGNCVTNFSRVSRGESTADARGKRNMCVARCAVLLIKVHRET